MNIHLLFMGYTSCNPFNTLRQELSHQSGNKDDDDDDCYELAS